MLARLSHRPAFHAAVAVLFVIAMALGYRYAGGLDFVQGWGGGIAASIATYFLIFKSQGYWIWMIVNAALWTYLFFHVHLPMLAYLQISFLIFACYGFVQWALVRYRIGFDPRVRTDVVGSIIAFAVFVVSLVVYWNQPGYRGSVWWWLEFGSVLTAIAAMWGDAFRYRANWIAWTLSNVCSAPLFYHGKLWGPFWTIFVYQTFNCYGWIVWSRDQRRLNAPPIDPQLPDGHVAARPREATA
jgi:hypothetical protein